LMEKREAAYQPAFRADLRAFEPYTCSLEALLGSLLGARTVRQDDPQLLAALDGQASERLRELVAPTVRKEVGAFFTGRRLCDVAMRHMRSSLSDSAIIFDPACGAGDLLLACAQYLPLGEDRRSTLVKWGEQFFGNDLHSEFARAARARL